MIIRAVRAENLLKYAQLTLSGLPETGLIGISGPNESGKSSIGEILCFGLFGRSYAVAPEALSELLKWGERAGSVEVDFGDGAGVEYTVSRYLDADGVQSASLARAGEVLVRGVAAVDAAVSERLGLTYGEFIDTFCLAQREILLPHAQGATVRSIVGLDRLERVGQELNAELGREREAIERLKREVASLRLQVMELNVEEEALGRLEAERAGAESGIGQAEQEAAGLVETQAEVQRAFAQLHDATEGLLRLDANTSLQQCREHASSLATAASALECARRVLAIDERLDITEQIDQVIGSLKEHEAAYQSLCQHCAEYREQLACSLGERPGGEAPSEEPSLPQMHRRVMCQISEIEARCQRLSSIRFACWSGVFLLLAVAGTAVGLTLFVSTGWHAWLADTWPEATSYADSNLHSWRVFIVPAAIALVGLVDFVFFFRSQRLSKRLNELQGHSGQLIERMAVARGEARVLDNLAVVPFPVAVAALRSMPGQALVHSLTELAQQHPLLNIAALSELKDKLHTAISACRREVLEWDGRIAVRLKGVHEHLAKLRGDVERIEGMLRVEHQRGDRAAQLTQAQGELEHRIAYREQSVQVRERALQFLAEARVHLIERFNEQLGRLSAEVLPALTGGRYRRLQCDAMLNLHAFSREEKGLLPLAQLPDTVQRCAGLLLRRMKAGMENTGVEQTGVEKAGAEPARATWLLRTFVLDDPLPGEALSAAQVQALSTIAGANVQLWLLSAEFRRGSRIQACIKCSRRRKTLTFAARSKNISRESGRRAHWHCSSGESVHATGVG